MVVTRGRPRGFDEETALKAAMCVFWRHGYEGASMSDLTAAMKLNRPSVYAAFGNKASLFRKAIDLYARRAAHVYEEAIARPTVPQVLEALFSAAVDQPRPGKMRGCMLVQSALTTGDEAEPLKRELAKKRLLMEHTLSERFERARRGGELPPEVTPQALAKYAMTMLHGLAVQSAGGASDASLRAAVAIALRGWRA